MLERNPGCDLDLAWVESTYINLPSIQRRAATLSASRTVKKEWQAAWLLRAITCIDLTTLGAGFEPAVFLHEAETRSRTRAADHSTTVAVNIVKSLYEKTCEVYRLGNLVTGQVRSVRGVRQGCTLSPLLFGLYTEELAVRLRMSGFGLKVRKEKLSCLLYADDIVVVSESEQELQMVMEIVNGYSRDFNGKFGGDKSKVMVIDDDEVDRDKEWNIGEVKIGRTKVYKYLGCMLSEDGCARAKGEKVVKAMQW
ncbi:Reverse transcriptase domain [Trinorchestia longiramus]|nr:Reverse transcriptase domain [Trinorchestia longiramus]